MTFTEEMEQPIEAVDPNAQLQAKMRASMPDAWAANALTGVRGDEPTLEKDWNVKFGMSPQVHDTLVRNQALARTPTADMDIDWVHKAVPNFVGALGDTEGAAEIGAAYANWWTGISKTRTAEEKAAKAAGGTAYQELMHRRMTNLAFGLATDTGPTEALGKILDPEEVSRVAGAAIVQAGQELGVIGKEAPPITEGTAAEAAAAHTSRGFVPYEAPLEMPLFTQKNMFSLIRKGEATAPGITSPKGAVGTLQIMPATAAQYGFRLTPEQLMNEGTNTEVGKVILNDLTKRFGQDPEAILIGWNAGPGMVNKWLSADRDFSVLPAETQSYLRRAMHGKWVHTPGIPGVHLEIPGEQGPEVVERFANQQLGPERTVPKPIGSSPTLLPDGSVDMKPITAGVSPADMVDRIAVERSGRIVLQRRGPLPPSDVETLATASGIPSGELDPVVLGRKLPSGDHVQAATEMLLKGNEDISAAAKKASLSGSVDDLEEVERLQIRQQRMRQELLGEKPLPGQPAVTTHTEMARKAQRLAQLENERAAEARGEKVAGSPASKFVDIEKKAKEDLETALAPRGRDVEALTTESKLAAGLDPRTELPQFTAAVRAKSVPKDHQEPVAAPPGGGRPPEEPGLMPPAPPTPKDSWFYRLWRNALLSGYVSHTRYWAGTGLWDIARNAIVKPVEGGLGLIDRAIWGRATEAPYILQGYANLMNQGRNLGMAMKAFTATWKSRIELPMPGEVSSLRNKVSEETEAMRKNLGFGLDSPTRFLGAVHAFYEHLGFYGHIGEKAYFEVAQMGLKPWTPAFWREYEAGLKYPTAETLEGARLAGVELPFTKELGITGQARTSWIKNDPFAKWVIPFRVIPANLLKQAYSFTPGPLLDSFIGRWGEQGKNLAGMNGKTAQYEQLGRTFIGGALGAWAWDKAGVQITGAGPLPGDPNRPGWLTKHPASSILIGDRWVPLRYFPIIGPALSFYADMRESFWYFQQGGKMPGDLWTKMYAEGAAHFIWSVGNVVSDTVGLSEMANLFQLMDGNMHDLERFLTNAISPVTAFRQTASIQDPYLRNARTWLEELKTNYPILRQQVPPKIGWDGLPVPNPQYHAMIASTPAKQDPVLNTMMRLQLHVAAPIPMFGKLPLTENETTFYQSTAGILTHQYLNAMVQEPGFNSMPAGAQENAIMAQITRARKVAKIQTIAKFPRLLPAGVQQRQDAIMSGRARAKLNAEAAAEGE